jgi:hypothetical protein
MCVVDASEGEILTPILGAESKIQSYPFFTKSDLHPKYAEEILKDVEKNQIIRDLKIIKPEHNYKIPQTGQYTVVKVETKVPVDVARRMIKEGIVDKNKAKYDEAEIHGKATSIYIPKWIVNIEAKNKMYAREALAASSTVPIDEISLCPEEFFARLRSSRKQTYAVCESCGGAYCSKHIKRNNNSYFCKEHS